MDPVFHDIDQVAAILGVHRTSVQKYIESGVLKGEKRKSDRRSSAGCGVKSMWYCTDEQIAAFRAGREAKKRINEKAEQFAAGVTEKPCATSASTTVSTEASSPSTKPAA